MYGYDLRSISMSTNGKTTSNDTVFLKSLTYPFQYEDTLWSLDNTTSKCGKQIYVVKGYLLDSNHRELTHHAIYYGYLQDIKDHVNPEMPYMTNTEKHYIEKETMKIVSPKDFMILMRLMAKRNNTIGKKNGETNTLILVDFMSTLYKKQEVTI